MDKDLLRLVILGMGGVLIVGILLWGILANRKSRRPVNFYDQRNPLDNIDESLIVKTGDDDFDIVPLGSAVNKEQETFNFDDSDLDFEQLDRPKINEMPLPEIIQFSIVAKGDMGFGGDELLDAFKSVGLQYTDFQIFQRLDINGLPEYAVASMVEPGTFPEYDMSNFRCPGIVFFMQPDELDNPLEVFDEMLASINHLSQILNGVEWNSERQPLSEDDIKSIRAQLNPH